MNKTTVIDIKNNSQYTVHQLIKKIPQPNAAYGLWIISFRKHNISPRRHKIIPRYFEFYGLTHLTKGTGWYWNKDNQRKIIEKNYGVLTSPGTIHDYCSSETDYVEDSICFAGPIADLLFKSGIISDGIIKIGFERRLLPIFKYAEDPSYDSQIKANFALQKLLIDCYFENKKTADNDNYPQITYQIEQIQQNPGKWWSSQQMAEHCNLSENQFRKVFKTKTGIAPKQYIDQVKIKHASGLLCNSSKPITEIAVILGYNNPYHFSHRFKCLTGMAPEHYRRHYSIK